MATRTYTQLAPPDVEVEVETVTQTPTISLPTLVPVAVGPCYQIVEVTETDGSTNSDALVTTPAVIRSNADQNYTIAAGPLTVTWKVNNGSTLTTTFANGVYTAAQVVSTFNATTGLSGAVAEVVEGVAASRFQLRTTEEGAFKNITITGGSALTALGLPIVGALSQTYAQTGYSNYDMTKMHISPENLYDEGRDNMDELDFDTTNITVAYDDGSGTLTTVSSDSTIERWGSGLIASQDDGDGDGMSPIVRIPNTVSPSGVWDLNSTAAAATVTATNVFPGGIGAGEWIEISVNGGQFHRVVFAAADPVATVRSKLDEVFGAGFATGDPIALDASVVSGDKGSESCILINPNSTADLGFSFGLIGNSEERTIGTWWAVQVDDAFYADGTFIGYVSEVYASAGTYCEFKLDREIAESTFDGVATHTFYFVSRNLTAAWISSSAPTPDVYIDSDANITVKHRLLRTTAGAPSTQILSPGVNDYYIDSGVAYIYVGYKALRLDVSASAASPGLLSFDTSAEILSEIGPISTANPLALGAYLMKITAPGNTVYALGIDETSADYAEGTSTAYSTAADFLESEEVYCIVPLTQERTILDSVWKTHVEAMSEPEVKRERVAFGTISQPTRAPDTVVASGTEGATTAVANEFNTQVAGLSALLLAEGIDPGAIAVADDVYIDIETDALNYNITGSVVGPIVTGNTTFAASENLDGFYSVAALPTPLINETWSLKIRGAELVTGTGAADKTAIAQALADIGVGFASDRVICAQPDTCTVSDSGVEMSAPSYYAACVEAGKTANLAPQQGFTNTTTSGILGVSGASDYFSETQLNIAAGGGIWWWYQQTPNSSVTVRHQLTTDTTTIITREYSIRKTLDYVAKTIRENFRPLLGRYNISEDLLSLMGAIMNGVCRSLVEEVECVRECEYSGFEQDVDNPDTLDVVLDVVLLYPFNKLRVKIRI